jgi:type II secretory pathway pseudopilin PulG
MTDERGFSLIELLVSIASFIIVLSAVLMITQVATSNQSRIAKRVAVNQRARPVMTRLIDELHSACVAPRITPVLTGSTGTSISFLSSYDLTGESAAQKVSPTPDLHVVSLSGGILSENVYPSNGGAAPVWTFSSTASDSRQLLTDVTVPTGSSLFEYYDYDNGNIDAVPLTVPLSATNAALTVKVDVNFTVSPAGGAGMDTTSPITLSDSAIFRLESASNDESVVNVPCA